MPCAALDPASVPRPEVPSLFRQLDHIARLASGAKLRLLRRLDDAAVGPADGARTTAEWVARRTGTSVGAARDALDTSKRLEEQRATDEALAKGELRTPRHRAAR